MGTVIKLGASKPPTPPNDRHAGDFGARVRELSPLRKIAILGVVIALCVGVVAWSLMTREQPVHAAGAGIEALDDPGKAGAPDGSTASKSAEVMDESAAGDPSQRQ